MMVVVAVVVIFPNKLQLATGQLGSRLGKGFPVATALGGPFYSHRRGFFSVEK